MGRRLQFLGSDEGPGQGRGLAMQLAEQPIGMIAHLFLAAAAVGPQDLAAHGEAEHRLQARRHVVGQQGNRAGRRHRGHQGVADPVAPDGLPQLRLQGGDALARQVGLPVVERKGALLAGQRHRRQIGGAPEAPHPKLGQAHRLGRAVAHAAHDQGIGQTGDAEADAALGQGFLTLGLQGKFRDVDGVVEHPQRHRDQVVERLQIEARAFGEGIADQAGQIHRPEQTGPVGRQRLFAAGIGGTDLLAVVKVVQTIDAVDEDHAGLGAVVGRPHDAVPERPGAQGLQGFACEPQGPVGIFPNRLHEGVGDQDREVEPAQPRRVALGIDEGLDIRMVAAQRAHHGAAPGAGAHDGPAHGVPDVHEAERARGIGPDPGDQRALGPEGREVVTDPAAALQGQRRLLQVLEDPRHVVGHLAHDEAVEQRHPAIGPGAGQDAPGRDDLEVGHGLEKAPGPGLRVRLRRGQGLGNPRQAVLRRFVHRPPGGRLQPVLHVPNRAGEGGKVSHGKDPSAAIECKTGEIKGLLAGSNGH